MRLKELPDILFRLPDDLILLAVEPLTPDSMCILGTLETLRSKDELQLDRFSYFLGVSEAKSLLVGANGREIPPSRLVDLLLFYAVNDSFPPWANELGGENV